MMEISEAYALIEELKGRYDSPFSSEDKNTIERLYGSVLGKTFRPTSCQQCYHDALIEIYHYLKKNGKMAEKSNFILKAGAIIHSPVFENGKVFTNDNLTDEVAMNYLAKFPGQIVLFQKVPEGYKPGDKPVPTFEEAQALLKKADTLLKGAQTKVKNIQENIQNATDATKREKAEKALEKAQKALEKAEANYNETAGLVEQLTEKETE